MGANHFSQVVFGADVDAVRTLLVAWMRAKGLALQAGAPLTALDPEHERGLRLAWRDGVVVVLGDTLQELDRQAFELRKLERPLLELWMHDSDIWGYQLWSERSIVSAFHSNPTYFGTHEPALGPNDVETLCRLVGGDPDAIRRIQGKKAIMAEGLSQAFADAIGASAAATQYRYAAGPLEAWPPPGWESEHLWFRHAGWDPLAGFDASAIRFEKQHPHDATADLTDEERAAVAAEMEKAQRQAARIGCLMRVVFWPLQLPMRAWLWWRARQASRARAGAPPPPPPNDWAARATVEHADGRLRNPDHAVSIPVPDGAAVGVQDRVIFGPPQVLRFQVAETWVQLNAHMPNQLRQLAAGVAWGGEVDAETRAVGAHTVRWARVDLKPHPGGPGVGTPRTRLLAVLAGPRAVYTLDAIAPTERAETVEAAMLGALEGLRFDDYGTV